MTEEVFSQEKLIIITAPSGAGKTTIAHRLLREIPELAFTISVTTRAPRPGERDGVDYYFVSREDFQEKIEDGQFVESEKVYKGKYYGTLYSELQRIWKEHKFPLRVVDVKGAKRLKTKFGDRALSIFLKPPSIEVLRERLVRRNLDTQEGMEERLSKAIQEIRYEKEFDRVVVNKDLEIAVDKTLKLIKTFIYAGN